MGNLQPAIHWVIRALCQRVKRPVLEAIRLLQTKADFRNDRSYTPSPPVCRHDVTRAPLY